MKQSIRVGLDDIRGDPTKLGVMQLAVEEEIPWTSKLDSFCVPDPSAPTYEERVNGYFVYAADTPNIERLKRRTDICIVISGMDVRRFNESHLSPDWEE